MKRKKRYIHFLKPTGNPGADLVGAFLNNAANNALEKLDHQIRKMLELDSLSPEEEIKLRKQMISVEKDMEELLRFKKMTDREMELLDLRIATKRQEMGRAQSAIEMAQIEAGQLQLPTKDAVIVGALELTADPKGLAGASSEQLEGYNRWIDSLREGKVVVIAGARGTGKTCLGAKVAEFIHASFGMPIYWVGLPPEARQLLPTWISMVNDPGQCPLGSVIFCDEAGLEYCATLFGTSHNRFMGALLMIARHRHCSLIFCVQSTADMDLRILRQADSVVFKALSLNQAETERPVVRKRALRADLAFKGMSKMETLESAFVSDRDWEGVIRFSPPSFWSENLSHVYGLKDLGQLRQQMSRNEELQKIVASESHQLQEATIESRILELSKEGHGIDAIKRMLGCSQWKVRTVLADARRGDTP